VLRAQLWADWPACHRIGLAATIYGHSGRWGAPVTVDRRRLGALGWLLLVLLQLDLTGLVVRLQARPLPTEKIYLDPWCRLLLDHIRAFYRSPRFCKSESSVPQCVRNQLCYFAFVQKR